MPPTQKETDGERINMDINLEIFSDYVWPFCWLAEPAVSQLASIESRVNIHWTAFELRPHPVPTLDPDGDYLNSAWQEHVYPLAEKMGFTMKQPPVQPRTRLAHAAAKWAADNGRFEAFNIALFKAFFQDGLDIGKLEILAQIAEKLDMDPNALEFEAQMDSYVRKVLHDQERAKQINVRAVPAFVSNGKVLAAGVQSLSQLQHLVSLQ